MFTINIHKKFPPSKLGKQSQKLIIEPLKPQTRPKEMHDPNPRFPRPSEEPRWGGHPEIPGALTPWRRSYIFDEESCSILPPKNPKRLLLTGVFGRLGTRLHVAWP